MNMMDAEQRAFVEQAILALFADRPTGNVSQWCADNLWFNEPDNRGPFSLEGREYIREPLDAWADPAITDQVLVFGSQTGKTASIMGGAAWTIVNEPARFIWVMPTEPTVRNFSQTRWTAMLRDSPELAKLIPTGARRHQFATHLQQIGHAIVDLVWAGSPAALASVPARVAILDEVDKFAEGGGKEANSVNLAEQRTKKFATPKRIKTSTPTLSSGLIWQELAKTNLNRRFMPCPHCAKPVVLAWSKDYTVFPITGSEAWVRWDETAKTTDRRGNESWDLDRVEQSARYGCPHCDGDIHDAHKTSMDRNGQWQPTQRAATGYQGWHLPSLYANSPQTNVGHLAVKFLQAKQSLEGLQGFINGELAEPWENQEDRAARVELVVADDAAPIEESQPFLTADYQLLTPHLPYVIRTWNGHSRLVTKGFLDSWEQLREVQLEHGVPDNHVGIDSGHNAEEVYSACMRFGQFIRGQGGVPVWVGWTPMKGFDRRDQWAITNRDPVSKKQIKIVRPYNLGTAALPTKRYRLPLLEFSTDHVKDILERLRESKTQWRWEVNSTADDEYWLHMDAELRKPEVNPRTNRVTYRWVKRSKTWPDHLRDAEIEQIVMALLHKRLPLDQPQREPAPEPDPNPDQGGSDASQ